MVLVLLGLGMFLGTGDEKYGLDFTGGTVAGVRLATPVDQKEISTKLGALKDASGAQRYLEIEVLPATPSRANPLGVGRVRTQAALIDQGRRAGRQDVRDREPHRGRRSGADPRHADPDDRQGRPRGRGRMARRVHAPREGPVGEILAKVEAYADANGNRPFAGAGLSR
jgi:hypothetical protein